MTDEHADEPDFDDPAHLEVRDLLASAKVDTPVPAEVAARLEASLAELTGGTAAEPHAHEVVRPLRRERREAPRRAPRLLAAAAVLIAAGAGAVGLNQVVGTSGSDDKAGSPVAADSAGGTASAEAPAVPTVPPASAESGDSAEQFSGGGRPVPVLTTADFFQQADALGADSSHPLEYAARLRPYPQNNLTAPRDTDAKTGASLDARARACPGPQLDGTRSYPIVLDQQPAVLVVHPASAGSHLVEAWSCAGSKVLASATLPD